MNWNVAARISEHSLSVISCSQGDKKREAVKLKLLGYEITWVRVDLVRVDLGYELTVNHINKYADVLRCS